MIGTLSRFGWLPFDATLRVAVGSVGRRAAGSLGGETADLEGLQITFEGVSDDSRCPTGVQCVWAGDASATLTLQRRPAAAVHRTLHTNGRFERQTEYEGLVVRLDDIKPYPKNGVTIARDEYRATLVVTRR